MKPNVKKTSDILLAAFLLILCVCTAVYAGAGRGRGHGPMGPGDGAPPADHLLGKAIHEYMAAQVIAGLVSGKETADLLSELAETHMMAVLENNGIDPEAFKTAMNAKVKEVAVSAFGCGLITESQATEITEQINASDAAAESTEETDDSVEG